MPINLFARLMREREIKLARRDTNRRILPFDWGLPLLAPHVNGDDPRHILRAIALEAFQKSDQFFALPPIDDFRFDGETLLWTSAITTPERENNTARARFFAPHRKREDDTKRAVLVLPQWNADEHSHVELCRLLNRFGVAALRLTLPYHEARRPSWMERADYLVSANIGRTLLSMRQAVVDARAAVHWLSEHAGFDQIGIVGSSVGSCTAFLAFVHDERIKTGVFNHVSSYFADVVWRGISTAHVRTGFADEVSLEELRVYWLPISPLPYAARLAKRRDRRPFRFIAARYDLTFPPDLSQQMIAETLRHGLRLDVAWLPCGHYTSGERPWKYLDGWKIASFLLRNL
ncbi:alpha/beta hydrolase family protein [Pyrinomonas methylaliphatogenes]|uniref:Dienelactone hydrolase-like enzyme n=1 Tax=Pyrinomonas methylaliphatogenes TaxID=454194 RepID=A0A0B6WV51_9BACT|nr:alpha/beta hydrolase family protein [Pyrinomonas methylaliphatogenes]CDM64632.1 dienelactone hydrolase-like enzyme [Pyrinomonas methylaliphatogenes]